MTHDAAALLVRPASESDAATIARLAEEAGMGVLTPRGIAYVAVSEGRVVGFIRIVEAGGDRYVNPIVVAASAQRQGVGRALMEEARTRYGALLFVARGSAVPFYTALGCERVGRERISPALGEDCDTCPDLATCSPVPMIYR
ncbi:GNAT family N-acetyltransferase [Rubneribacter badeniensis]|uniref:GNAT family N-acetyltransferase n=1 Tax=Rubneribacter badeniensis TaxID=2070688 RepID=UPI003A8FE38D